MRNQMKPLPDMQKTLVYLPGIGKISTSSGMMEKMVCSCGSFRVGQDGVKSILATRDEKVEFIAFDKHTLAYINSSMGHPAFYPVRNVHPEYPVKYVLTDLDGTTVRSEDFWVWIIQLTVADLLGKRNFSLQEEDLLFVSGHSVSEHLQYCISKYCPDKSIKQARLFYFENTQREMEKITRGEGRKDAFKPTQGLKDFLVELKMRGIKIALVTSGLYEKAYPELLSVFNTLKLGPPEEFYDVIITAGEHPRKGGFSTLGELEAKPHPWLYSEAASIGLGVKKAEMGKVVGIDDSGAGICAIRLAGFSAIGFGGGNILESGTVELCDFYGNNFEKILQFILNGEK